MKWFFVVSVLTLPLHVASQCLDTLNTPVLNPGCNLDFTPVCGCDGVTYRNPCYAEAATVLQYVDRPCEQVAINFYPNPVIYWLYAIIVTKYEADVNLLIFDRNGNIYYSRYLRAVNYEYLTIPVHDFHDGMYILMVESNGVAQFKKFIKWNEQQ
ncbi:MAG: hypothetical protein RL266_419 [Bacteroidota bacterium]|jgi:hypothetical protein